MTQKTLSLRLDDDLFDAISKRAEQEGKTKTDLVKELITLAMNSNRDAEYGAVISRLDEIESNLKSSIEKGAVCSAANRFYGKQITTFMLDIGTHIQGKPPLTREEKISKVVKQDKNAEVYAKQFLSREYKSES